MGGWPVAMPVPAQDNTKWKETQAYTGISMPQVGFEHMIRACEWQKTGSPHALELCTLCDVFVVTFWLAVIN